MRLRRRPRFDILQNEVRRRGRSWGRWIYVGLLCLFVFWVFDLFLGNLFYFSAQGIVMRDRVVLATQFLAAVKKLTVHEGAEVSAGQLVAQVRSQTVEATLAKLYTQMVNGLTQRAQLKIRDNVNQAISAMAVQRQNEAQAALMATNSLRDRQLLTIGRRAELIKSEIDSAQKRAEIEAEHRALETTMPELEGAVKASEHAIKRLQEAYANGVVKSPVNGIVGHMYVSPGSVIQPGAPLMDIFTGTPYVLAYVPEGGLYELEVGDGVQIRVGLRTYLGHVSRLYPLAQQLPKELQSEFQPQARARLVRVDFSGTDRYPPLFSKTKLSAAGWPPAWLLRLLKSWWHETARSLV